MDVVFFIVVFILVGFAAALGAPYLLRAQRVTALQRQPGQAAGPVIVVANAAVLRQDDTGCAGDRQGPDASTAEQVPEVRNEVRNVR